MEETEYRIEYFRPRRKQWDVMNLLGKEHDPERWQHILSVLRERAGTDPVLSDPAGTRYRVVKITTTAEVIIDDAEDVVRPADEVPGA